nr:uncharacterized protein CI109_007027 [Kwoniella shandongensis]KAA5524641.1 hypothetical protein CI109_007027 [Kwoniella shandongensis]
MSPSQKASSAGKSLKRSLSTASLDAEVQDSATCPHWSQTDEAHTANAHTAEAHTSELLAEPDAKQL